MATHSHDWLSLVVLSGLTVSEPVLMDTFPDGPPTLSRQAETAFRREYNRWLTASDPQASQRRWVRYVLEDLLTHGRQAFHAYPALDEKLIVDLTEYEQRLHPNRVLVDPNGTPQVLIVTVPQTQDLDRRETETGRWRASPFTKINRLLRETGVPLGLLTNGDTWRLVYADAGLPTATIEWTAQGWSDERSTLRAFLMLLGRERFAPDAPDTTLLSLLRQSQDRQVEVADQLGDQVRAAIRVFVRSLDDADRQHNGDLLADRTLPDIYEMTLLFMMRLVFLLYAEERKLLPHGEMLYDQAYGLTYLFSRLRRQHRETPDLMPVRHDAWLQLLATFNVVYTGVQHPDFNTPAYGGDLFDPARFPTLADPRLQISNAVIHDLLMRLLMAVSTLGGERVMQRVSYRSLGVEQFGFMYEGLLDHLVLRAEAPLLALRGAKHHDPILPLAELTRLAGDGEEALVRYLKDETGRSESALRNALHAEPRPEWLDALRAACDGDDALYHAALPFAALLDADFGVSPLIKAGQLYIGPGPTRRATGTHYTPLSLTEPIVKHTLEPLVYTGPAEGLPEAEWRLKPAADLLDLKICDMAMGSGAFLVQACRYMAGRLTEAWDRALHGLGSEIHITPHGKPSTGQPDELLIPDDEESRETLALRLVADRCLYGVDKNRLAVDIAKLSLWLLTMDRSRPFTFLDHALKHGDSLVGVSLQQLGDWSLEPKDARDVPLLATLIRSQIADVVALRKQLAGLPVNDIADRQAKQRLLAEAEAKTHDLRRAATLLLASYFNDYKKRAQEAMRSHLLDAVQNGTDVPEGYYADVAALEDEHPFHWDLEFPEVFLDGRGGFDAFIGNPPFMGGVMISRSYGTDYVSLLRNLHPSWHGQADLCAMFFTRSFSLMGPSGALGLIATNTISQTDTMESGLEVINNTGGKIYKAVTNIRWPSSASVFVSAVHIFHGDYKGQLWLDDKQVARITPFLDDQDKRKPLSLAANTRKSFLGSAVIGMGFVLEPDIAYNMIALNPRNKDVLYPYLNGKDLNSSPSQSPQRWIINFFDWGLERAQQYIEPFSVVAKEVYPVRAKVNRKAHRQYWWHYGDKRPALYRTIEPLERVLAIAQTSRTGAFVFVEKGIVYSHKVIVFAFEKARFFALLQSDLHGSWARQYSSTLKQDLSYTPTSAFQTFPFPDDLTSLDAIGETYHETRRQIMLDRQEGLTKTYNRFHDPDESASDITHLRALHVEMDNAVAAAYGWADLDLDHGFHETAQGIRYTISEPARREVLTRLLKLNHARYHEEAVQGLHGPKARKEALAKAQASGERPAFLSGRKVGADAPPADQLDLFEDDSGGGPKQGRLL